MKQPRWPRKCNWRIVLAHSLASASFNRRTIIYNRSDWGGCSERCGPGIQERMRLSYAKGRFTIQKMSRHCQLSVCSSHAESNSKCFLTNVPEETTGLIVNICKCPNSLDTVCSSLEAIYNIEDWILTFRNFCAEELNKDPTINLFPSYYSGSFNFLTIPKDPKREEIQHPVIYGNWIEEKTTGGRMMSLSLLHVPLQELSDQKNALLGRFIRIRFNDGYYFDCEENWGLLQREDVHTYCKIGTPLICKAALASSIKHHNVESFLEVDDIDIHFNDSLYDTKYSLYGQEIHSVWIRGIITGLDCDNQCFDIDDKLGRVLRIQFDTAYTKTLNTDTLELGTKVSIICAISHVVIDQEALLYFKLNRISRVTDLIEDYWTYKVR